MIRFPVLLSVSFISELLLQVEVLGTISVNLVYMLDC